MVIDELLKGESRNIEYKEKLPNKSIKYIKTIIAFSNCSGGHLIFGIKDNSMEIVGIEEEKVFEVEDAIMNAIWDSCYPMISPNITHIRVQDKILIDVQVYPGKQRPYYVKNLGKENGTYVRAGATSRVADLNLIKDLEFEGSNMSYDQTLAVGSKALSDEDINIFCDNLYHIALKNCKTEEERRNIKQLNKSQLEKWELIVNRDGLIYPTNGYLLLTSDIPYQYSIIQCGYFKGTTRKIFLDHKNYEGNIIEQIEEAYQYVLRNIRLESHINGLTRVDEYEIPIECIREIICNAVCHRSYIDDSHIQVALYDDRLEVTSPGSLPGGLTVEDIKNERSYSRNKGIVNAFLYMKIIENWGSGIKRIIDLCLDKGLKEPEFIEMDTAFRVNIYRKNEPNNEPNEPNNEPNEPNNEPNINLSDEQIAIIKLLINKPQITYKEMSVSLEISLAKLKRMLKVLKEKGIIIREGTTRKGKWIVNKSQIQK